MLKETLKKDEIAAMKARDKARVSVLRLVNSEIKSFEVNNREDISDENVIKIVEKSIKQNKEALEYAIKANDEDKIAENSKNFKIATEKKQAIRFQVPTNWLYSCIQSMHPIQYIVLSVMTNSL